MKLIRKSGFDPGCADYDDLTEYCRESELSNRYMYNYLSSRINTLVDFVNEDKAPPPRWQLLATIVGAIAAMLAIPIGIVQISSYRWQ
jgi:hypothetical protein